MRTIDWTLHQSYKLGSKKFMQEEIFEFAQKNDPLDFHLDLEAAQKSIFKGLVCSGGQAFYHFYAQHWVPLFGKTVLAGMGLNEWKFHAPIYVEQMVHAECMIKNIIKRENKEEVILVWYFEFYDNTKNLLQDLNLSVLHKSIK